MDFLKLTEIKAVLLAFIQKKLKTLAGSRKFLRLK